MRLNEIASEGDLRYWLQEWISECRDRLNLEWVEPMIYGSTVGAPDCKIKHQDSTIGLELKYLLSTKKGIKWTLRPAQRRYHHMNIKQGGRSALLAYIPATSQLVLVRGDHIPLRDYASDPDSGCKDGLVRCQHLNFFTLDTDKQAIFELETVLFDSHFWEKRDDQ